MSERFVIDTSALIYYFHQLFVQDDKLSPQSKNIIDKAFSKSGDIILIIPSIVFVEIQSKWFNNEEFARKFYYEVFTKIKESPFIEIKPLEKEVLENLLHVDGILYKHDIHDKIIVASAIMLNSSIITTDKKIENFVKTSNLIPSTFC